MRRRLPWLFIFVGGLLAGSAGAWLMARAHFSPAAARAPAPDDRETPGPVPAEAIRSAGAGPTDEADLRAKIRASVASVLAEQRRGRELEIFLQELEAQARKQGRVTALEVQTGLAALDAAYPEDLERGPAFARRMESLARELDPRPALPDPNTAGSSARVQLRTIESMPPGPERDKLTPAALAAIDLLPLAEQDDARKALDRATAQGLATAAPPDEEPARDLRAPDAVTAR
jgi:hypothetical protein